MSVTREEETCIEILKEHGAVLARERKHRVWKLPDGRTFVMAKTASDRYTWRNNLSDLRNFLGINGDRGKAGVRRERKRTTHVAARVRADLSCDPALDRVNNLRSSLCTVMRTIKPAHVCCYPMEKQTVVRTPVTVILGRIFA
jgi:hypothetical protein